MNYFFYRYLIRAFVVVMLISGGCSKIESNSKKTGLIITSPELAEIVYHLDGLERIKGVTLECTYPEGFAKVTKIGSFGKIDIEKIVQLNPEKVYLSGLEQDGMQNELAKMGIATETCYINSIEQFKETIEFLGKELNREEKATDLIKLVETELNRYSWDKKKIPDVYIEIYGNPLMSVADSSLVGELVAKAGGNNIFDALPRAYSRINIEDLILANPDVIILTYPGITAEDVKNRKGWDILKAVQNDKIYTVEDIDPDLILRATPRMLAGLKKLNELIYE